MVVVTALLASGCQALKKQQSLDYHTVEADPRRDTARAEKLHAKAVRILERCPSDYCCECIAAKLCNPCRAEKHLQEALIADVRYGPAHNSLGSLYYSRRALYLAAWEFQYAAQLMPERPEPLNNLGLVYEAADKLEEASGYYEQAVELAPDHGEYLGNLARARLRAGAPLDEVRYLLEQLVFVDTRPDWVAWAQDQLGAKPIPRSSGEYLPSDEAIAPAESAAEQSGPELMPAPAAEVLPPPPVPPSTILGAPEFSR